MTLSLRFLAACAFSFVNSRAAATPSGSISSIGSFGSLSVMGPTMHRRRDKVLSKSDKSASMSDTAYHMNLMREAFPRQRHGGAKAAIYAAFRYVAPKVQKPFTERRARSIWEGTARRIDAEESTVLRRAALEEARREQAELRDRLSRLDTALAAVDPDFHGLQMEAYREAASGLGRGNSTRTEGGN
jgi:hypothetical protein